MIRTYKQEIKERSRKNIWEHSIFSLTYNRSLNRILNPNYIYKLWDYAFEENIFKYKYAHSCDNSVLSDWLSFSDITYRNKNANELKVAFFCGAEPENDIMHLLNLGIRIENIYAFEYEKKIFKSAVESLKNTYPNLKIYNGNIEHFIESNSAIFDIIYLDFTKSIINEFKTICKILDSNILSELSVLIVNTTLPEETEENIDFLTNYFLYQSCFEYVVINGDEQKEGNQGRFVESCSSHGIDYESLKKSIKSNFEEAYSAFQTNFIINYSNIIKPIYSVLNNSILKNRLFINDDSQIKNIIKPYYESEDIFYDPEEVSLHFFLNSIRNDKWLSFFNNKERYTRHNALKLFYMYLNSTYDNNLSILNQSLKDEINKIQNNLIGAKEGLFCDIPMIHLWLELAVNQLGLPYHHNSENHKRFSYRAKERKMFIDIFTFDKCRSLYDWLPMVEYYGKDLMNMERQILSRICIDAIGKHSIYILEKQYFGSAIIGWNEKEWSKNHSIEDRIEITE